MLEDGEIIRRCQSGQPDLVDVLIDRYKIDLYSLCRKLTCNRDDADDLFQDTCIRVMKRIDHVSPDRPFKTWLFAICVNRYRDLYRWHRRWRRLGKKRGRDENAMDTMGATGISPEQQVIAEESKTAVRRALDALEDAVRLPMLFYYFHDLSVEEISGILGIPGGTVKSRLHRGREELRTILESSNHGP